MMFLEMTCFTERTQICNVIFMKCSYITIILCHFLMCNMMDFSTKCSLTLFTYTT